VFIYVRDCIVNTCKFLADLGQRISSVTSDDRQTSFLFQKISDLCQFNSLLLHEFCFWWLPGGLGYPAFYIFLIFSHPCIHDAKKINTTVTNTNNNNRTTILHDSINENSDCGRPENTAICVAWQIMMLVAEAAAAAAVTKLHCSRHCRHCS